MHVSMVQICKLTASCLLVGLLAAPVLNCAPNLMISDREPEIARAMAEEEMSHYLELPSKNSEFNEPLHQHVREALSKLPIEAASDPHATLPTPHRVLAAIREAKRGEKNSAHRAIYEQLAKLADEELNDCSTYMVEVIKSVWAQTKAKKIPKRLAESLKGYLFLSGENAMEYCVDQIKMEDLDKNNRAERALSEFFSVGMSVKVEDESLYTVLKSLNLHDNSMDAQRMSSVANKWVAGKLPPNKQQPLSLIRGLLDEMCHMLRIESGTAVDMVNLARLFGSSQEHLKNRKRLLKLNELNRLCVSWRGDSSYVILDHFHKLLNSVVFVWHHEPSGSNK